MAKPEYRLSPKAIEDLRQIWTYVADRNEPAADSLLERIHNKISDALDFPLRGSRRASLGPKARILVEGHYVIIYEPADYGLFIVAIAHSRKRPADWLKSNKT